ncbi:hypothetical protein BpHYR1_036385 [Brachionus plicatilis]|uniref:Uncharacterized protein n=1 Tax=Brachionus plicatilis TaxID=10195 RepID=A0A3M7SNN3_BRAPC|nr:hypothetical protein BpHYR1_036385 [Brachionus plicatilis]
MFQFIEEYLFGEIMIATYLEMCNPKMLLQKSSEENTQSKIEKILFPPKLKLLLRTLHIFLED